MKIEEFDTNGLIFGFDRKTCAGNWTDDEYEKALMNIMTCQNFSCFPLVNGPRIRENTNDLTTRAVYMEGGGSVTSIVRRSLEWEERELKFFLRDDIEHVDEGTNLLQAASLLLSPNEEGEYPLFITVGGTKEHPTALFSLDNLLQHRTKAELYRQLSLADYAMQDELNMMYTQLSHDQFDESREKFAQLCKILVTVFSAAAKKATQHRIDRVFARPSSNFDLPTFGRFLARDIMQHACVGIRWKTNSDLSEQPNENTCAKRLLMGANDFDNLAIYSAKGSLLPNILTNSSRVLEIPLVNSSDTLVEVINNGIQEGNEFVAVIRPDKNILTGEGAMPWPAIITKQELFSMHSLINCLVVASAIEHYLIHTVLNMTNQQAKNNTLGSIHHICNTAEGRATSLYEKIKNSIPNNRLNEFRECITFAKDLRNKLAHGLLRPSQTQQKLSDSITLKSFTSVYKIRDILGMNQ